MKVAAIHRFPVKSLGHETLRAVDLTVDEPLPGDRRYAVTHGLSKFDPDAPEWVRCGSFLRLAHTPEFSRIMLRYESTADVVTVSHPAAPDLVADLNAKVGREALAEWMGGLPGARPGPYSIAEVPGVSLSDADAPFVSLHTDSSLAALSAALGTEITRARFRGNFWIDGAAPWAEEAWVGKTITLGEASLEVIEPIWRCRAPDANPETGERHVNVCDTLTDLRGDSIFGVYARVITTGRVANDDSVSVA